MNRMIDKQQGQLPGGAALRAKSGPRSGPQDYCQCLPGSDPTIDKAIEAVVEEYLKKLQQESGQDRLAGYRSEGQGQ